MQTTIKAIGVVLIVLAVVLVVKPAVMTALLLFFRQGKRIYIAAAARLALAVVFLTGAGACRNTTAIVAMGILFGAAGLAIIALRDKICGRIIDWYIQRPAWLLRATAITPAILGGLVVYWA